MKEELIFKEPLTPSMSRIVRVRKIVYSSSTPFQQVDVVETDDYGTVLYLDKRFQTSEAEEFFYHESLVHPAMICHGKPERVLIVGGGDGGALEEVTKYSSVSEIDMVELDEEVTKICQCYLPSVCGKAFDDPRLRLHFGDGRKFVEECDSKYDVIILDLTDPMEPSKYVYTREFYKLCKDLLNSGGILALHSDSPFFYPEAFNTITKTVQSVFPCCKQFVTFIPGYLLDFAFTVCSQEPLLDLSATEAAERLRHQGVRSLRWYDPSVHPFLFTLPLYAQKILENPCSISTDLNPYVIPEM